MDAVREASPTCDQSVDRPTAREEVGWSPSERMFIRAGDKEMRHLRMSYVNHTTHTKKHQRY